MAGPQPPCLLLSLQISCSSPGRTSEPGADIVISSGGHFFSLSLELQATTAPPPFSAPCPAVGAPVIARHRLPRRSARDRAHAQTRTAAHPVRRPAARSWTRRPRTRWTRPAVAWGEKGVVLGQAALSVRPVVRALRYRDSRAFDRPPARASQQARRSSGEQREPAREGRRWTGTNRVQSSA